MASQIEASVVTQLLKMVCHADPTDLSHPLDPRRFVSLALVLFARLQEQLSSRRADDSAFLVHDTATNVRRKHFAVKLASNVGRDLVPVLQRLGRDDDRGVGIPDDDVGVVAGLDAALALVESRELRRCGAHPGGDALDGNVARVGPTPYG